MSDLGIVGEKSAIALVDRRSERFLRIARPYARRRLAKGLDGVFLTGLGETRAVLAAGPAVIAANHVAWWDPLLLVVLDTVLGGRGYALMDAGNLAKLPFFGWLGALPLGRGAAAAAGLEAGAAVLREPGDHLYLFPQGRQRPPSFRPLGLKPGLGRLIATHPRPILPLSIHYHFREREVPAAILHFGAPIWPGVGACGGEVGPNPSGGPSPVDVVAATERALEEGLSTIDRNWAPVWPHGIAPGAVVLVAPRGNRQDEGLFSKILAGAAAPPALERS
jgi:hypothetical protein